MLYIMVVLSIPVYVFGIWGLYDPVESALFLNEWRYKKVPEFSEIQIKLMKFGNVIIMIIWTLLLIEVAIDTFTPKEEFPFYDL